MSTPDNNNNQAYPPAGNTPYNYGNDQYNYGTGQYNYGTGYGNNGFQPQLGMKWFKFIIWVQLFLSALGSFGSGILLASGQSYDLLGEEGTSALVYAIYSGLRISDLVFGIAFIALAAFSIFVRFRLARFRADGPMLYLASLICEVVVTVLYAIATSMFLGEFVFNGSDITTIVTNIVLIILNTIYFKKRKHLFVN